MPRKTPQPLTRVLLLRHAEKPAEKDDPHLSPTGLRRAHSLAAWLTHIGTPDVLIAAKSRRGSARPYETLVPLARRIKRRIDASFDDKDPDALAAALRRPRYRGKTIVIAWRHDTLPALARALGATRVPMRWHKNNYARVWEFTLAKGRLASFRTLRQPPVPRR